MAIGHKVIDTRYFVSAYRHLPIMFRFSITSIIKISETKPQNSTPPLPIMSHQPENELKKLTQPKIRNTPRDCLISTDVSECEDHNGPEGGFSDYDHLSDFDWGEQTTDEESSGEGSQTNCSNESHISMGAPDDAIPETHLEFEALNSRAQQSSFMLPTLSFKRDKETEQPVRGTEELQQELKAPIVTEEATEERPTAKKVEKEDVPSSKDKHTPSLACTSPPFTTQLTSSSYFDAYAEEYIACMNANPTTYHFVTHFKSVLDNNGFTHYDQQKHADLSQPGFYYTSLEDQTLVAFIVGGNWNPLEGSCFVGTHVDAVGIKVNPAGSETSAAGNSGYEMLGVAPYSGPISELWVSRDLGLAGSVTVKKNGIYSRVLIDSKGPIGTIAAIPEFLAAAAEPGPNGKYNIQTNAVPIIGYSAAKRDTQDTASFDRAPSHSPAFLNYISNLAAVSTSEISTFDLHLYDIQPATRGGISREFIYSSSLDDRLCSFDAMYGLLEFSKSFYQDADLDTYNGLVGVYFANHEEIGSGSRTGAQGGFLLDSLKGIISSRHENKKTSSVEEELLQLTNHTIFLSSDVTHCLNPNFRDVYLEKHMPKPNTGPTIKIDSNQHVLTDSIGHLFLQNIVDTYAPGVELQQFHIRNDSRSGGTIGPMMSSGRRGLNGAKLVIDVGMPILSMHSVRGIMGAKDVGLGVRFFKVVFGHWQDVASEIEYEY